MNDIPATKSDSARNDLSISKFELRTPDAKDADARNPRLQGIWSPCLTPINKDCSIDEPKLSQHVGWLLERGCNGVVLFGTTGEATSFSATERMAALEFVVASGVSSSDLMIGNGFASIADSLEVTRHALGIGSNSVLMLPPFYYKSPAADGVAAAFRHVFDNVNSAELRVVLYHYPRLSAVPITHQVIRELIQSHGDLIAGLKDSSGDWGSIKGFIQEFPDLLIFPGTDMLLLRSMKYGGAGTIAATANINPTGIRRVYDLWNAGEPAEAAQLEVEVVRRIVMRFPLSAALKAVHAHYRDDPSWNAVRPPLTNLSSGENAELIGMLNDAGFELPL